MKILTTALLILRTAFGTSAVAAGAAALPGKAPTVISVVCYRRKLDKTNASRTSPDVALAVQRRSI